MTITTNKVASMSDLNTINKYTKNVNIVDPENIMASQLPQSKSYLKILGISYIKENINAPVSLDFVE